MASVRFTEFKQNLATHFDTVLESRAPLLVTRQGKGSVIVLAEGEYESLQETLHLLSTPANADRLHEGLEQLGHRRILEKDPTAE
ncbi:type II toxin-antitoxin system Phd/YefM family antitoxin [Neorhizobium sp. NPDC001467]|uniref:type II toxin-antitoxin system Phd/YefM family antitoxin n=1 Tax=Neorhizobium sp. NPDC001467 TaxID=3390595 RepID=UPI003CFCFBB1